MNRDISKRITTLQVLLIVLVVFIHNNSMVIDNTETVFVMKTFISEMFSRTAVPIFFFISGYLLYQKEVPYGVVLKRKAKTLLVPYLLWNTIVIAMFFIGQNAPFVSQFFNDESNQISHYTLFQWLDAYLGLNYQGYPAAYPLWFIRDLMVFMLFFPIGKWLVEHFPAAAFLALTLTWLMQWRVLYMDSEALLFFMLGCYVVQYDLSFEKLDQFRIRDLSLAYSFCLGLEMFLLLSDREFIVVHKIGILAGCLWWIRVSKWVIGKKRLYGRLEGVAGYTFFVYAFHEPFMTMLRKVWAAVLPTQGSGWQMVQYFGVVLVVIILSLAVGWCLKKICPRVYALLTGGRTKSRTVE